MSLNFTSLMTPIDKAAEREGGFKCVSRNNPSPKAHFMPPF